MIFGFYIYQKYTVYVLHVYSFTYGGILDFYVLGFINVGSTYHMTSAMSCSLMHVL